MSRVYVYVVPDQDGWQVRSRGMVWDLASRQDAVAFADDMARRYASKTCSATCVRVHEDDGFRVHAHYEGERDTARAS